MLVGRGNGLLGSVELLVEAVPAVEAVSVRCEGVLDATLFSSVLKLVVCALLAGGALAGRPAIAGCCSE